MNLIPPLKLKKKKFQRVYIICRYLTFIYLLFIILIVESGKFYNLNIFIKNTKRCKFFFLRRKGVSQNTRKRKRQGLTHMNICKYYGGVWFVFSNNNFQFLNNILRISTYFFTQTFLQIFLNNNFQFLNTHTKRALKSHTFFLCSEPQSRHLSAIFFFKFFYGIVSHVLLFVDQW